MSEVETAVVPPDTDEESDGGGPSCRVGVHVFDTQETCFDAAVQLFDNDADDPDKGADALLRVILAAAQLRGPDYHWALMQRLVAFDGTAGRR